MEVATRDISPPAAVRLFVAQRDQSDASGNSIASNGSARTLASPANTPTPSHPAASRRKISTRRAAGVHEPCVGDGFAVVDLELHLADSVRCDLDAHDVVVGEGRLGQALATPPGKIGNDHVGQRSQRELRLYEDHPSAGIAVAGIEETSETPREVVAASAWRGLGRGMSESSPLRISATRCFGARRYAATTSGGRFGNSGSTERAASPGTRRHGACAGPAQDPSSAPGRERHACCARPRIERNEVVGCPAFAMVTALRRCLHGATVLCVAAALGVACTAAAPQPICPDAPAAMSVTVVSAVPSVSSSATASAKPRVFAALPMRRVLEDKQSFGPGQKLDPTPFIDVEGVDKQTFLLGVHGIQVWDGKAFVRNEKLEKGLSGTHESVGFGGKYPSHLFVVTGHPKMGTRRLYERTGDTFKEVDRCEHGTSNEVTLAEWGDGVVSVCSMMGEGPTKVFGKGAWKVPALPRYKKKLTGDHACHSDDAVFEPRRVKRATNPSLNPVPLFELEECRGNPGRRSWAYWVPEAAAWVPAAAPDESFEDAAEWRIVEDAGVLYAKKGNDPLGELKLPDADATLVRWHVISDVVWVVARWTEAGKTADEKKIAHAALYTSAP